jgi:alpha-N-arabinofuranosidase
VAGIDAKTREIIVKVVNPTGSPRVTSIALEGSGPLSSVGRTITMSGPGPDAENSFEQPEAVAPIAGTIEGVGPKFEHTFPAWSVTVLRLKPAA